MPPEETADRTARVPANAFEQKKGRLFALRTVWYGREIEFGARKVNRLGLADKETIGDCIAAPQTWLQG